MDSTRKALTRTEVVLLLGAGASKPLGLPLMNDFWQILYNRPFLDRARRALDKAKEVHNIKTGDNGYPDLEGILDLVETYYRYYEIMFNDPVFKWDMYDDEMKKYWLFPSQEPKKKNYIQSHIKNDIELSLGISEARDALYQALFSEFSRSLDSREVSYLYDPLLEMLSRRFTQQFVPVFTTNYDLVLERYGENPHVFLETGFERQGGRLIWSPSLFEMFVPKGDRPINIVLFKLHGSISWRKEKEQIVDYGLFVQGGPGDTALIYPTQTKEYPNEEPFKTAYRYLEDCLSNAGFFIVVGYSFRDRIINGLVNEALEKNARLRVISIFGETSGDLVTHMVQLFGAERISFVPKNFKPGRRSSYLKLIHDKLLVN